MPKISLGSGSNPARYGHAGATRHINCVWEPTGDDSKNGEIIIGSDGLESWVTLASTGVQGGLQIGPYFVVKSGRVVYRIDRSGTVATIGGMPTDGQLFMARNRRTYPQVGLLADGLFYCVDTQSWTLSQINDTDLPPGGSLAMLDGFGLITTTSGRWFTTGLDDFTTIDPLEFGTAASNPDENVCVTTREGEAVIFGTDSTEWWRNTGGATFSFEDGRVSAIELGCLCAGGVQKIDRTVAWIANDATVRIMEGYGGREVSVAAVVRAIEDTDPTTIRSTTWWRAGAKLYAISSPGNWTWVYNLKTDKWHERQSHVDGVLGSSWRVSTVARFGTDWIAGDRTTGALYKMKPTIYTEGTDPLVMIVQTPPVHGDPSRLQIGRVFLQIIPGVGLYDGGTQDVSPNVMVQFSDNGGYTWSNQETIPLGALGDYDKRGVPLTRQGTTTVHGRTYRFAISAAVARAYLGATIEAEALKP